LPDDRLQPEELMNQTPPMPYWAPEQLEETYAMHQTVLAGQAPLDGFEITFMRKNGERFHALVYEAKLIDGNGNHTGWMASVLDITERKRAEELARQQQEQLQFTSRLVTMGEMASTLAHELNQPLAAIASYNTGCLNLLQRRPGRPTGILPGTGKDRRPGPARRQDHSPRP
jgi:two-component system sensor histidine kinase DctS